VNTIYLSGLKYLFNKSKRHTEMNLTLLGGEVKYFVALGRSDVTPTVATRRANTDMVVKWRLNPRK
jgi:hypothetical protein